MNIFTRFKKLNIIPTFPDEEQNRIAGIILITALSTVTGLCLLLFHRLVAGSLFNIIPLIISSIFLIFSIVLTHFKLLKWAGNLLLWTLLGFLFTMIIQNDGIHDSALLAYPGLFVMAGLILSRKYYIFFSLTSLLTIILVGIWEIYGIIENSLSYKTSYIDIVDLVVILGVTSIIIRLLADNILNSLKLAYEREKDLRDQAAQLIISEERFRQVVETVPNGITVVNKEGKIIFANKTAENILGLRKSEIIERTFNDPDWKITTLDNYPFPEGELPFNIVKRTCKPVYDVQHIIENKEKGNIILSVNAAPLFDENNNFNGMIAALENITERKSAEMTTKAAKEYAENLIETANTIVVGLNAKGKINVFNKAAEEISGYSREELENSNWFEVLVPKDKYPEVWDEFNRLSYGGLPKRFENPILTKSGEERQIVWSNSQVIEDGQISGTISFGMDITERKRAEEALKESEEHFRKFIENASVGACLVNIDGKFVNVNKAMCDLIGYSEEELREKTFNDITYFEDRDKSTNYVTRMLTGEINKFTFEKRYVHKDGHPVWGIVSSSLIRDGKGNPKYFVIHVQDITERKRAEEILTLFSHTFKSTNECISITDLNNQILFVNQAFLDTYGYSSEELIGKSIYTVRVDPVEHNDTILDTTIQGGWKGELFNRKKDGSIFPIYLSTSVVFDENKKPVALVGAATDITERKASEEKLRLSEEKFSKAFRSSPMSITLTNFETGRLLEINDSTVRMFGFSKNEAIGISTLDLNIWVNPNDRELFTNQLLSNGFVRNNEYQLRSKNGKTITTQISADVIEIEEQKCILTTILDISEQKHLEKELRANEERYRRLVESVTDYIYSVKLESGLPVKTIHGPGCAGVTGFTSEEFESDLHLWYKMVYSEDRIKVDELLNKIISGKDVQPIEHRIIHKDNSVRWIRNIPVLRYNSDGVLISYEGLISDITERKLAEEVLRESEEQFRSLAEQSPNMIFINCSGKIVYANKQCEEIMEYSKEELYNDNFDFFDMIDPDYKTSIIDNFKKHLNGEELLPYEYSLRTKYKKRIDVILASKLINYKGARAILGIVTDVTERKHMEEALRDSEERYRNLYENAPIGIYRTTPDGSIILSNQKLLDMLNFDTFDELKKRNLNEEGFQPSYPREKFKDLMDKSGEVRGLESAWFKKDGTEIYVRENAKAVKDARGKIIYYDGMVEDITERKKAVEALTQSEERMRAIVEGTPHLFFYLQDFYANTTYVSPTVEQITGYKQDIWLKRKDWFITNAEINKIAKRKTISHLKGEFDGEPVLLEVRHSNGNKILLEAYEYPIRLNNKVVGLQGVAHDITERKKTEEALREREKDYKELIDGMNETVWIIDLDGNIIDVNKTAVELLDYSKEEFLKIGLKGIDSSLTKQQIQSLVNTMPKDKFQIFETSHKTKDGKIIPVEVVSSIITYRGKKTILSIARDVTERRKAEEALRESENTLRVFINAIPEASLLVDTDGNIVSANQALAKSFGENTETIVNKNLYKMLPAKIAGSRKAKIKKAINQNKPISFEDYYSGHFYYNYVNPILDDSRKVSKIAIIGFDITERKKAEIELEQYRLHLEELIRDRTKELEEVNSLLQEEIIKQREAEEKVRVALEKEKELSELKSKFISIASHEFRTPLTTVLSSTELLERYGRTWEHDKYVKQTDRIRKSVKYLTNLMDEVLIISRADTGKIKFEPKKTDLEKLCKNILEDIKLILTNKHSIDFDVDIGQKNFMLDEKLLKFIILNLLSNAIKYSPKGGNIGFKVCASPQNIIIEISDEGIGIPEEDRIHLFDPFNRGSNVGDIHGTGLGMSIIKRSVDMYNGSIEYESKVDEGTTFVVSLPVKV